MSALSDRGVTRAESCVIACADAWRGAGEVMASPFGTIPSLGARLAKLTFAPDLVLTDGEAALMVGAPPIATRPAELVREAAMPYRSVFDVVWSGPAPHHDDGEPDRPHRQPEHLGHRPARPPQGAARRRARRPGQLGQPPDQLLGARPHRAHVRGAGRRRQRRRLRPGRRGRTRRHPLPRRPARGLEPRRLRLRDARSAPCGCARTTPASPSTRSWPPPGSRSPSPTTWPRPACPTPEELDLHPRRARPRLRCATARCGAERRRRRRARCTRRCTPRCASGSASATRWCRPAWAGWPAPAWSRPPARRAASASWPRPP